MDVWSFLPISWKDFCRNVFVRSIFLCTFILFLLSCLCRRFLCSYSCSNVRLKRLINIINITFLLGGLGGCMRCTECPSRLCVFFLSCSWVAEQCRRETGHRRSRAESNRRTARQHIHTYARRTCEDRSLPAAPATRHPPQPRNRKRK